METEQADSENTGVFRLIQARGFRITSCNPNDQLFMASCSDERIIHKFYDKLGRYSFRLFLRELLENQDQIKVSTVSRYCSAISACRYLEFLAQLGLLQKSGEEYRLTADFVPNFGQTLEWYVAEIFKREFAADAIYRATIYKSTIGGDLDVLANWMGRLVYLEVKSSPPKAVDASQVQNFFYRLWELLPEVAVFLEDTHLRMADKIVPLFMEELFRHYGPLGQEDYPVLRLKDEIFHVNHCVYIINSKHGFIQNLGLCLRDYLRNQRQLTGMP